MDYEPLTTYHKAMETSSPDPYRLVGDTLAGKYMLMEYAGGGGMGAVYKAMDNSRQMVVAVKILKPDVAARSPEYIILFEKEVKAAQRLRHPNIVRVLDNGFDQNLAFMVMEWLDGDPLEDLISRQLLEVGRIVNIFEQVCSAMTFAHSSGVIHLDIKPSNLMLVRGEEADDFVKVIDFGLSRIISKESGTTVTKFRGTHQYCAPEQFGGKVSHRSDIYSLGATLYYALAGVIPFGGSYINAKIHPNLELPPIPSLARQRNLPAAVDVVLRKALQKNPALRHGSALQLFEEFIEALKGGKVDGADCLVIGSIERKPNIHALKAADINRKEEIRKARQLAKQLPKSEIRFLASVSCGVIGGGLPLSFFVISSEVGLLCYILIIVTSYVLIIKYRRRKDLDFTQIYLVVFTFMIIGIIPIFVSLSALWWLFRVRSYAVGMSA